MANEPPYGPPIIDAIARGDLAEMKALVVEAEDYLREHGDVSAMLQILKIEVARLSAEQRHAGISRQPPNEPDYGPPIQDAIARGDLAEMKAVLKRAEATLKQQGDLATAVAQLRVEIAKLEQK